MTPLVLVMFELALCEVVVGDAFRVHREEWRIYPV